jgi:hypothetical protein
MLCNHFHRNTTLYQKDKRAKPGNLKKKEMLFLYINLTVHLFNNSLSTKQLNALFDFQFFIYKFTPTYVSVLLRNHHQGVQNYVQSTPICIHSAVTIQNDTETLAIEAP